MGILELLWSMVSNFAEGIDVFLKGIPTLLSNFSTYFALFDGTPLEGFAVVITTGFIALVLRVVLNIF